MYCYNCGNFFPDEDVEKDFDWETGPMSRCPLCGCNDLGETEECAICGKEFVEGEISHGFCLGCLWEAIDYDVALEYMKYLGKEAVAEFMLNDWFDGLMEGGVSDKLAQFMEETYKRLVADEKLRCAMCKLEEARFLEACRLFCLPDYPNGDFGVEGQQFVEWYSRRKKEAKNENSEHRNS